MACNCKKNVHRTNTGSVKQVAKPSNPAVRRAPVKKTASTSSVKRVIIRRPL